MEPITGHKGHSHDTESLSDLKLFVAIGINVGLTVVQVIGGLVSGSLSLIADALHNLSDAGALGIALLARVIGRKPPDVRRSFGYRRAEVIAALINLTTLILVGLYLVYEALWRLFNPEAIEGWIVVVIAGVALCIDLITAFLTFSSSKNSVNIKAAFLHNVSDAMASLGVMLAGSLILLFQWYWVDTLVTLVIAGVVLWQGTSTMPVVMQLLMDGTPEHVSVPSLVESMTSIDGVEHVYHVHVWKIDEHRSALEAHVQIRKERLGHQEDIKRELRELLKELHSIEHSTLEIEVLSSS